MLTNNQVRKLMKELKTAKTKAIAAARSGMDEKTARKYERLGKLPGELMVEHNWRTREDPFSDVWPEMREKLKANPGLEAKTLFDYIRHKHPGTYQDGQLRTLQRHIKRWRATEGSAKEVYFPQVHYPGDLCQSDFTNMNTLGITISGQRFNHLIFHFVLPYSNWESGSICFSESFESLSEGLQNALWELGGVPKKHRTDRFTAAISSSSKNKKDNFTFRYLALLRYYRVERYVIGIGKPHENGDVDRVDTAFNIVI